MTNASIRAIRELVAAAEAAGWDIDENKTVLDNARAALAALEPVNTGTYTVAIYLANKAYGGPEEGGWWYEVGELYTGIPEPSRTFDSKEDAFAWARELNGRLDREYNDPRGSRANMGSVLCEGRYVAKVCEGEPESHYPKERPYYE